MFLINSKSGYTGVMNLEGDLLAKQSEKKYVRLLILFRYMLWQEIRKKLWIGSKRVTRYEIL